MSELELTFRLDDAAADRWQARLRAAGGRVCRVRVHSYDTPDGRLSGAGVALRLRSEDGRWVQTLSAPGSSPIERFEDEVVVDAPAGAMPDVDATRHHGGRAAAALRRALGNGQGAALVEQHAVAVERLAATFGRDGGETEVVLDRGTVTAAAAAAPIAELGFGRRSGPVQALFEQAGAAALDGGLWLSTLSNAERGARQAGGRLPADAVKAATVDLPGHGDGAAMLRAVLRNVLAQVLPNASHVAEGADDAEMIHQLRVGLRRLRTALRELAPLSDAVEPGWEPVLGRAFALLGERRDNDAVAAAVRPLLQAAHAPKVAWAAPAFHDTAAAVRDAAFQCTLLRVLALAHGPDERFHGCSHGELKRLVARRLDRLDRAVRRHGRRFDRLAAEDQHRVRKRLKRLRYLAEFARPLWSAKAVDRYVERLRPAQEALGAHNDGVVAAERFRAKAATDPAAWFAAGFLAGRGAITARASKRALRAIGKDARFWR